MRISVNVDPKFYCWSIKTNESENAWTYLHEVLRSDAGEVERVGAVDQKENNESHDRRRRRRGSRSRFHFCFFVREETLSPSLSISLSLSITRIFRSGCWSCCLCNFLNGGETRRRREVRWSWCGAPLFDSVWSLVWSFLILPRLRFSFLSVSVNVYAGPTIRDRRWN